MTIPHICLASPGEPKDVVKQYAEVLSSEGRIGEVETYSSMFHGWMGARSNLQDAENAKESERGSAALPRLTIYVYRLLTWIISATSRRPASSPNTFENVSCDNQLPSAQDRQRSRASALLRSVITDEDSQGTKQLCITSCRRGKQV